MSEERFQGERIEKHLQEGGSDMSEDRLQGEHIQDFSGPSKSSMSELDSNIEKLLQRRRF